jgi:hypothetical protein
VGLCWGPAEKGERPVKGQELLGGRGVEAVGRVEMMKRKELPTKVMGLTEGRKRKRISMSGPMKKKKKTKKMQKMMMRKKKMYRGVYDAISPVENN